MPNPLDDDGGMDPNGRPVRREGRIETEHEKDSCVYYLYYINSTTSMMMIDEIIPKIRSTTATFPNQNRVEDLYPIWLCELVLTQLPVVINYHCSKSIVNGTRIHASKRKMNDTMACHITTTEGGL